MHDVTTTPDSTPGNATASAGDDVPTAAADVTASDPFARARFMVVTWGAPDHSRDTYDWEDLPVGLRAVVLATPDAGVWDWVHADAVWHVAPYDCNN